MNANWTRTQGSLAALLAAVGLCASTVARADDPRSLAPPLNAARYEETWDWRDVPQGERIPLVRAVFDRSGYRLYDARGQAILVPFVGGNLYVMKFARCPGPTMYFVNEEGDTPVLYVPDDGYLENDCERSARWYPFPQSYDYRQPLFLGPAPSWDAFITMGWYSGMVLYGGYYVDTPWRIGARCRPTTGWYVVIGGRPCYGWDDYWSYSCNNPARRVIIVDRPYAVRSGYGGRRENDRRPEYRRSDREWPRREDRPAREREVTFPRDDSWRRRDDGGSGGFRRNEDRTDRFDRPRDYERREDRPRGFGRGEENPRSGDRSGSRRGGESARSRERRSR